MQACMHKCVYILLCIYTCVCIYKYIYGRRTRINKYLLEHMKEDAVNRNQKTLLTFRI